MISQIYDRVSVRCHRAVIFIEQAYVIDVHSRMIIAFIIASEFDQIPGFDGLSIMGL